MYKLLFSSRLYIYYIYAILQKAYFRYRVKKIKRKKKDGIDPISTAFDQMKVINLFTIYLIVVDICYNNLPKPSLFL